MDRTMAAGGPGRFFADHPILYRLSLAGSTGTAGYAAIRALRARGTRRIPWIALALLEATIAVGIMDQRRQAP
jgi:hypothetical protein